MHTFRTGTKLIARTALLASGLVVAACGGVTAFQGKAAFAVAGTPPAPPPPPPKVEEPPKQVVLRDDRIEIKDKIQFEYNKAVILPASFSLCNEIADVIKKNPQIKKLSIEGHASSEGDAQHNLKLSDERAKSVMKYLTEKGVEAGRLAAKGWGAAKPIADNKTEEGKEKNRRVEFLIVEQDVTQKKVEIDKSGKEKVLEEKKINETKESPPAPAAETKPTPPAPAPKAPAPKGPGLKVKPAAKK